jgi:tRNA(Ile2) C34 agmatinyltransferase TiaS
MAKVGKCPYCGEGITDDDETIGGYECPECGSDVAEDDLVEGDEDDGEDE